jgi:hypothetical protein
MTSLRVREASALGSRPADRARLHGRSALRLTAVRGLCSWNLHSVWDGCIIEQGLSGVPYTLARQLLSKVTGDDPATWRPSTPGATGRTSGAHQPSGFAVPITPEQFQAWRERHFGLGKPGRRACREHLSVTRWTVWGIENGKWSPADRADDGEARARPGGGGGAGGSRAVAAGEGSRTVMMSWLRRARAWSATAGRLRTSKDKVANE